LVSIRQRRAAIKSIAKTDRAPTQPAEASRSTTNGRLPLNKIKLTVLESRCRAGIHQAGQEFIIGDTCPPVCHELWQCIYPQVYVLGNGGRLDCGNGRGEWFCTGCPDNERVVVMGKVIVDN
jgi:uncharacterized repeat protein (TIGR04076 family)